MVRAAGSLSSSCPGQWLCLFTLLKECKWDARCPGMQESLPCLIEFIVSLVSAWNTLKGGLKQSYRLILVRTGFDSYQTWHAEAPEARPWQGAVKRWTATDLGEMSQWHPSDKTGDLLEQTGPSLNRLLSLLKPCLSLESVISPVRHHQLKQWSGVWV